MEVNYDKDIAQVLKALDTEEFCLRSKNCTSCPLGKLNVFQKHAYVMKLKSLIHA